MQSGIYQIKNKANGKVYIGSSKNLKRRFSQHKRQLNNNYHDNRHLQYSFNKYGQNNFEFHIIEITNLEEMLEREEFWINHLKSYDSNYGYNRSRTAVSPSLSDEGKKKLSEERKGKNNPFYGKTHSEESIRLIKEAQKRKKPVTEEHRSTLRKRMMSDDNPSLKVFEGDVITIKLLLRDTELNYQEIANIFNVTCTLIGMIDKNSKRKHIKIFEKDQLSDEHKKLAAEILKKRLTKKGTRLPPSIVKEIKILLKETGLTQREIADFHGIDEDRVSQIKMNHSYVNITISENDTLSLDTQEQLINKRR